MVVSDSSLPDTPCMPRLDTDLCGLGLLYTESCSAPCINTLMLRAANERTGVLQLDQSEATVLTLECVPEQSAWPR